MADKEDPQSSSNSENLFQGDSTTNGPTHSVTKGKRKQWVLHDGPHGSLQRLRLRMAEEGCGHSQVALARQLLSEESGESDQIAVHWLLKAADQGHYEAIDLLRTCLDDNRGITEHSYLKVKACLEMSHNERAARSAAKNLFDAMSQGNDFITAQQLENWLEENSVRKPCNVNHQITSYSGSELISEQHVMSAAAVYATGHFPPLLCLLNLFSRNMWIEFSRWLAQTLSKLPLHYLKVPAIVAIIILSTYPTSRSSFPYVFSTWLLFFLLSIAMTLHTFRVQEEWSIFRSWSVLLSRQANQLQPAVPESLYISRTYPQTLQRFVAAALPCISLQPMWNAIHPATFQMPYGVVAIIALLLFTLCWPPLKHTWDLTIEDVICILGWILLRIDHWDIFQLSYTYCINPVLQIRLDVVSVLAVCILVPFYVKRALSFNNFWHLLAWFLPHLTSLTWLFFALQWTAAATFLGLLRGVGFVAAFFITFSHLTLFSKVYLALLCLTSYSLSPVIGLEPLTSVTISLIVMATLLVSIYLVKEYYPQWFFFGRPWIAKITTIFKAIFVAACVALLAVRLANPCKDLLQSGFNANFSASLAEEPLPSMDLPETISWEQYRNYCHQPSWKSSSMAASQLACSALDGLPVQWEGVVKEVKIINQWNFVEQMVRLLPDSWAEWVACYLGEQWNECKNNEGPQSSFGIQQCRFLRKVNEQRSVSCHLNNYARYQYDIEVEPHSVRFWETKPYVRLIAGQQFHSMAKSLVNGDVVKFVGVFSVPSVGGPQPQLDVSYLECVVCDQGPVYVNTIVKQTVSKDTGLVMNALQGTADFVLPPFIKLNVSNLMY